MTRPVGQKIALAFAALFYLGAVACALGAVFYSSGQSGDPVKASLMASVVFFVGGGFVLQVIGTARLRGLLSGEPHESQTEDLDRD